MRSRRSSRGGLRRPSREAPRGMTYLCESCTHREYDKYIRRNFCVVARIPDPQKLFCTRYTSIDGKEKKRNHIVRSTIRKLNV